MKIIKEETGEDWTFEQVLKFAAYPGMKVMEELGVKDQEKTYARWVAATKLVEGDTLIESALDLDANETELLGHTIAELEGETGLDREAALADMRFNFIERLCDKTVVRPGESREHKRSVAIDRILTGKYTALPCFIGIMALVFWLTFGVIGAGLSDLLTLGIDALTT